MRAIVKAWRRVLVWLGTPKEDSSIDPGTGLPFHAPRDAQREAALLVFGENCAKMLGRAQMSRQRMEDVRWIVEEMDALRMTPEEAVYYARRALEIP